jgi:hypothetical protein
MGEDGVMGGGGAPVAGFTPQFSPAQVTGAENASYQGIGNLSQFNQAYNPAFDTGFAGFNQFASQQYGNPEFGNQFLGAQQAEGMGQAAATNAFGQGQGLIDYGNQVMNTAMDPQQALYNKYLGLTQQQGNALAAQSGVGTTPYGVGLEQENLGNFNIGWNAQQLQNQVSGLNAATGAINTGTGIQNQSANQYLNASGMMANTLQTQSQSSMDALSALLQYGSQGLGYGQQGAMIPQQQISDYFQMLGQVQPALVGAQNQTAQTSANIQAMKFQEMMQIAQLGMGLMGGMGGMGGGGGGGGGLGESFG